MDSAQGDDGAGFWSAAIAETGDGIRPQSSRGIGERADDVTEGLNNVDKDNDIEEESSDTSEEEEEPSGAGATAGDGEQAGDEDFDDEDGDAEDADANAKDEENEPGERMDADTPEEAPIKVKRDPAMPTAEERQKHEIAHLPPRPWCPICVEARAIEGPHRRQNAEQKLEGLPSVSVDYCEVGENPDDTEDRQVCLVARDKWTTSTWARLVSCKGQGAPTVVKELLKFIGELGYDETELKGDGEPALVTS